jgi:hypothetical protein
MEVDQQQQQQQQQLGSPCCSPTAAGQGHSSAGCRSQNSWACSSLLVSACMAHTYLTAAAGKGLQCMMLSR